MKRWCVWHNTKGEVQKIEPGLHMFAGSGQSGIHTHKEEEDSRFFCNAIDELGALTRFKEAWNAHRTQEQDQ